MMVHTKINNVKAALLLFVVLSLPACATEAKNAPSKVKPLTQSYIWYDGDRERQVWLNPQLVAEFEPGPQGEQAVKKANPSARVMTVRRTQAGIRLWQVDNTADAAARSLKAAHPQGKYSAVLHDGPNSSGRMRALPGNVIVYLDPQWDEAAVHRWLTARKLQAVKKLDIGPNIYVIKTGPGLEALDTANAVYRSGEVKAAFPDWWQEVAIR